MDDNLELDDALESLLLDADLGVLDLHTCEDNQLRAINADRPRGALRRAPFLLKPAEMAITRARRTRAP